MQNKEIIVLYKDNSRYDITGDYIDILQTELEEQSYETFILDINNMDDFVKNIDLLRNKNIKAFIGFEGICSDIKLKDGSLLQNAFKCPYYSYFLKNPVYEQDYLLSPIEDYNVIVDDEEYKKVLDAYFTNIKSSVFIPLGGIETFNKHIYADREYSIVLFGDYADYNKTKKQIDGLDDTSKYFLFGIIDKMLNDFGKSSYVAYNELLEECDLQLKVNDYIMCMHNNVYADQFVSEYSRYLVVKRLISSGIKIDVFGNGWNDFESSNKSNLVIHPSVSYHEKLEIMSNSKIVVNIIPELKNGGNEIVFDSMLSGAVCVTDKNNFLEKEFTDMQDIVFYDISKLNQLPDVINILIEDTQAAEKIALNGYDSVKKNHSWTNRAAEIIHFIESNENKRLSSDIEYHLNKLSGSKEDYLNYNLYQTMLGKLSDYISTQESASNILEEIYENVKDNIYAVMLLLSYEMHYFENNKFTDKILELVNRESLHKWQQRYSIYWYVLQYGFTHPKIFSENTSKYLWDIYTDVVRQIQNETGEKYEWIPNERRNKDRVIVFVSQFLSLEHGPTKTVLDRCEYLIRHAGKEVVLVNTAEFFYHTNDLVLYKLNAPSYLQKLCDNRIVEYNNLAIPFYQCTKNMPNINEIRELIEFVKEFNPYYVLNVGANSPTTDILSNMIPTLTISTVPSVITTTMGQFQSIGRNLNNEDLEILKYRGKTTEHIISGTFTSSFKPQMNHYSRKDLNLPENAFVITMVGGRLTDEVTDEFLDKILPLCSDNVVIALAGAFDRYEDCKRKYKDFDKKVINLGFMNDMLAVFECCDLYVNPPRRGGGTSAVEALSKGVPVVALPQGDVGLNVSETFQVNSIDDMCKKIKQYINDKKFYDEMSKKAIERSLILTDTDGEFKKIIDELELRIENMQ